MKILKVSISLTKNGFNTTIFEYEAYEKNLIYKLTRTLNDGFEDIAVNYQRINPLASGTICS